MYAYLWSETASQRSRHALRGGYVCLLRLDPLESLFRALFLFCCIREKERERELKNHRDEIRNEHKDANKHARRARARERENKRRRRRSERRTLMMRNGRPYSSNARDMLELYHVCKLFFFRARLRVSCDGSSEKKTKSYLKKKKEKKNVKTQENVNTSTTRV